jgi:hypothetical protein
MRAWHLGLLGNAIIATNAAKLPQNLVTLTATDKLKPKSGESSDSNLSNSSPLNSVNGESGDSNFDRRKSFRIKFVAF